MKANHFTQQNKTNSMPQNLKERLILTHLKNKNHEVFEMVFYKHNKSLVKFAFHYLIQ